MKFSFLVKKTKRKKTKSVHGYQVKEKEKVKKPITKCQNKFVHFLKTFHYDGSLNYKEIKGWETKLDSNV